MMNKIGKELLNLSKITLTGVISSLATALIVERIKKMKIFNKKDIE